MARGRGRPPAPPPPYESLTSRDYKAFVTSFETVDREARMLAEDRSQLKKDWRPKGLDGASHDFVMKWKRKIEAGKAVVQDLFGQIERIQFYADTLFGDQADLFREGEPDAPVDGVAAVAAGGADTEPPPMTPDPPGKKTASGNGRGKAAAKKGAGVSKGDAKGTLAAAKPEGAPIDKAFAGAQEDLGATEPAGSA